MERRIAAIVTIRPGHPADTDALERLENAAFDSDRLSRRSLRRFLAAATTDVAVAEDGGAIVGYAMIGFRAGSRTGRLFSLAVDARQGRRGIGRSLLLACEASARRRGCDLVRLEVRSGNRAAIALYEGAGYDRFAVERDYYEDGATALRFQKLLVVPAG